MYNLSYQDKGFFESCLENLERRVKNERGKKKV